MRQVDTERVGDASVAVARDGCKAGRLAGRRCAKSGGARSLPAGLLGGRLRWVGRVVAAFGPGLGTVPVIAFQGF